MNYRQRPQRIGQKGLLLIAGADPAEDALGHSLQAIVIVQAGLKSKGKQAFYFFNTRPTHCRPSAAVATTQYKPGGYPLMSSG